MADIGAMLKQFLGGEQAPQAGEMSLEDILAKQARAKASADMLRQNATFSPTSEMVGGRVVPMGWGGALAKVASGAMSGSSAADAEALGKQAQEKKRAMLAAELQKFTQGSQTDPQGAATAAMASQFPEIQKIGQERLKDWQQSQAFGTRPTIGENGELVVSNPAGQAKVLEGVTGRGPAGKIVTVPMADDMQQKYMTKPNGEPDLTRPVGEAFKRSSGVTVNMGNKADLEVVKQLSNAVMPGGKSYDKAEANVKGLEGAAESVASIEKGAKTGIATPVAQVLRKVGTALGVPNAETANVDVLDATLKKSVFTSLGGLGTAISDGDRNFVRDSMGSLTTEPFALKRLLALQIASSMMDVERHNKRVDALGSEVSPDLLEGARLPFSVGVNDPQIQQMVDNVLQGRETTAGVKQTPSANGVAKQAAGEVKQAVGQTAGGGLSPAEQAELAALRKRFGGAK